MAHPEHPLSLVTIYSSVVCCGCNSDSVGKGQMYNCSDCSFYLHTRCAICPSTKKFKRIHNHHEMTLLYQQSGGTPKPSSPACDICRKPIPGSGFFYQCAPCEFNVHLLCATLNPYPPATTAAASTAESWSSSTKKYGKRALVGLALGRIAFEGLNLLCEATTGISIPDVIPDIFDSTPECVGDNSGVGSETSGVDTACHVPDVDSPFEFFDDDGEDGWQWRWDLL